MVRARLGGDDHVPAAVPCVKQRRATGLAGPGSARVQQQYRLADGHRKPPARQRDEAPVDDREYVHEQPAAYPGPRKSLRRPCQTASCPAVRESLLHRPRLARGPASGRLAGEAPGLPPGRRDISLLSQRETALVIPVLEARRNPMTGTREQIAPGPANIRSCRVPRVCVDQSGWRSVMVAAGGPVRARVSARRSASGSRYRPAMRRTRSAASAAGIPAAVTNSGRLRIRADRYRVCRRAEPDLPPRSPGCRTRRARARPAGRPPGSRSA